jgi:hypothetical protein
MDLNMEKALRITSTAISTKAISSMAYLKEMEFTYGQTEVSTMATLSKDIETDTVFGRTNIKIKLFRDITCWIESMGTVCMIGVTGILTKGTMCRI